MQAFVATGLTPGPPAREENEQIENLVVPWNDILDMIERGEIEDGKMLTTLLLYERFGKP
jgi:hypothetical protein